MPKVQDPLLEQAKIAARFWAKVDKNGPSWKGTLCRVWTGAMSKSGYGIIKVCGRVRKAHRVSWELYHGPIPDGMSVLHHCDNTRCINSDHLFLGTQTDNMRDAAAKGRLVSANRAKTHCPYGHVYDEANTAYLPDGSRRCRACDRMWQGRRRVHVTIEVTQEAKR